MKIAAGTDAAIKGVGGFLRRVPQSLCHAHFATHILPRTICHAPYCPCASEYAFFPPQEFSNSDEQILKSPLRLT